MIGKKAPTLPLHLPAHRRDGLAQCIDQFRHGFAPAFFGNAEWIA